MIGQLRGKIEHVSEDTLLLDVQGVGYEVLCPARVLATLESGQATTLIIDTHVREDYIRLYGFPSRQERDWFRLLLSVQGVGARHGLHLLGVLTPEMLAQALAAQDKTALTRAPGVGPKLAARILTELKDKAIPLSGFTAPGSALLSVIPAEDAAHTASPASQTPPPEDAIQALVQLGYGRSEAWQAVAQVRQREGEQAPLETLIREGLRELAA